MSADAEELTRLRQRIAELEAVAAERDRALAALGESEERFRTICEHAPVMIDSFDEQGNCVLWNRQCERMLGYTLEDILTLDEPLALTYPDEAERRRVLESIQRADGRFREYTVRAADGSQRVQLWANFRLPTGALISVGHDITEQRQIEAQLAQAQKMEALGQLTGGIAHDFNNLLTVIQAHAELIRRYHESGRGEALQGSVIELKAGAERGAALIRKLLAFSRSDARMIRRVDIGALLQGLTQTLRALLPESLELQLSVGVDLPAVAADPNAIEQIVVNLATNARDAMTDRGTLRVEAHAVTLEEAAPGPAGSYVQLTIADDGTGLSETVRQRMFEPFFTTKGAAAGTGLGLSVVYGLVRHHHGQIDVESVEGEGTAIRILLPAAPDEHTELLPPPLPAAGDGRRVVLVVEDQPAIRRVSQQVLEAEGYHALVAANGRDALRLVLAMERPPDLILSDVVMPQMSGVQLYEALVEAGIAVPFVFMTGYAPRDAHTTPALALGVPLLEKPWSVNELLALVRRVLQG